MVTVLLLCYMVVYLLFFFLFFCFFFFFFFFSSRRRHTRCSRDWSSDVCSSDLAYQSAWLRHYHPAEYYCSLFNNQPMGFYSLDALGRDAKRNEVEIRLPDVNASDVWCTVEERGNGRLTAGEGGRGAEERGKGRLKA